MGEALISRDQKSPLLSSLRFVALAAREGDELDLLLVALLTMRLDPSLTATLASLLPWQIRVLERLSHGMQTHCISGRAVAGPLLGRENKLRLLDRLVGVLLLLLLPLWGWALLCGPATEIPVK